MRITLQNTGKRYNREWIFRGVNTEFNSGSSYAITGPNGSGKSTLLQTIAGALMPSEGKIIFTDPSGNQINDNKTHEHIAFAAPYLELIEEMTAIEMMNFHRSFKKLQEDDKKILDTIGLSSAGDKQIRYYSSGMKQRLKLGLAFYSETSILLLDEPTTNLDASGITLYHELIASHTNGRLLIICSNDTNEYSFCKEKISIEDYK